MAEKAHKKLCRLSGEKIKSEFIDEALDDSLKYSRKMGNCYTASMYVGLSSLLENSKSDLTGKRIGLFSYGSGCVGEFFSGVVQSGYKGYLFKEEHTYIIDQN